jgi:hypothetical protein
MPRLTNTSDQLAITIELYDRSSSDARWVGGSIAEQYYLSKENRFQTLVEGYVEIYEDDLSRLQSELRGFLRAIDASGNFKFVPVAEPSFELTFERISHAGDYCRVVSAAVDLKAFLQVTTPSSYGQDRVATRLHTTEEKLQQFGGQLVLDIDRTLGIRP